MNRNKLGILFAEVMGTAILAFVALTVSQSPVGLPYFTGIAVAATLGLLVLTIGKFSGAHVNPAVTLGMWTIKKIPTLQAIGYVAAQIAGALVAWKTFEYFTGKPLESIAPATFDMRILVAEMVATFVFVFGITAAVYQDYKGLRAAYTIGASLFAGITIASAASSAILNPAIAIAVHSVSREYMVGPLLGAVLGANVYLFLFTKESLRVTRRSSKSKKSK